MMSVNSYNPYENSLNNAKTIAGVDSVYEGVKEQVGKAALIFVTLVVGIPLVVFLGVLFKAKRKKFQRHMKKSLPDGFKNSNSYSDYKINLEKLSSLTPVLKKVTGYNSKKAPWPLRFTLIEMQKMSSTLITFQGWLQSRLDCMNNEQFKSEMKVFKFVPEEDLWKNRNKAYQYWM